MSRQAVPTSRPRSRRPAESGARRDTARQSSGLASSPSPEMSMERQAAKLKASAEGVERAYAQVLEAAVHGERHDHGARAETLREPVRADDVRARRDPREDALFAREAERHLDRGV